MVEGVNILKQTEIIEKVASEPTLTSKVLFIAIMCIAVAVLILTVVEMIKKQEEGRRVRTGYYSTICDNSVNRVCHILEGNELRV